MNEQSMESTHKVLLLNSYFIPTFLYAYFISTLLCLLRETTYLMQYEFYDREHLSRKTSLEEGTTDVYQRQWGSSDPVVRSFDKQVTVVQWWCKSWARI
jgi:hypothetical protein